jgi:hypothetical protein
VVSVKDYGAVGDGVTDDTAAIDTNFDTAANGEELFFPIGVYKISSTIEIPPGIILKGAAIFNGTNANAGTIINVTHDGTGFRFIRKAAGTQLTHNGGCYNIAFNGTGSSATVAQKLIELGDSATVDVNNGAWNGVIRDCLFNNTYGYGVYSAHSQSWRIEGNYFRSVRYGVLFATVSASVRITGNDFECSAASLDAYCIVLYRGTLGGASGAIIKDNYMISPKVGIWLANQLGTIVHGNTIEGAGQDGLKLDKYKIDGATLDVSHGGTGRKDGCEGVTVDGNTFINWAADSGSHAAIGISHSRYCYIGNQNYSSPNGAALSGIRVSEAAGTETEGNVIVEPIIRGSNYLTVPAYQSGNGIIAKQVMIRRDGVKLALDNSPTTKSSSDKGRMFLDSDDNPNFYDGSSTRTIMHMSQAALAGSAGASAGYITIDHNGTSYKVQVYAVS